MPILRNMILFLLLLPAVAVADWALQQTADGHWISTKTSQDHQLIVVHNQDDITHILLVLSVRKSQPKVPSVVSVTIDRGPAVEAQLTLLEQRPGSRLFRLELSDKQKATLVTRMIAGIGLRLSFGAPAPENELHFSLLGFTAALNDLFIADRVGRLDPVWLIENHRERELACYYTANVFVASMQERVRGRTAKQVLKEIPKTGMIAVDEKIPDIVAQVYSVPASQLPIDPRGDKFVIFEECMAGQ